MKKVYILKFQYLKGKMKYPRTAKGMTAMWKYAQEQTAKGAGRASYTIK